MRKLVVGVSLLLCALVAGPARAGTSLTKEKVAHFMQVIDLLQGYLHEASSKLDTADGVKDFRELAAVLRVYTETVGRLGANQEASQFVRFLVGANPWLDRNLGIADTGFTGRSSFGAMFDVLDRKSDEEIARARDLQKPLVEAAQAVRGASGFEAAAGPKPPEAAVLSEEELHAAVMMAALGVARFPQTIADTGESNSHYALPLVPSLDFLVQFLSEPGPKAALEALAKKSRTAHTALALLGKEDFVRATGILLITVRVETPELSSRITEFVDKRRFNTYAQLASGLAAVARESAVAAVDPSPAHPGYAPVPTPKPAHALFDRDEAATLLELSSAMTEGLPLLTDRIRWDRDLGEQPFYTRHRTAADGLRSFFHYLEQKQDSNYLPPLFYSLSAFRARNLFANARRNGPEKSVYERLTLAAAERNRGQIVELSRQAAAHLLLEVPPPSTEWESLKASTEAMRTAQHGVAQACVGLSTIPWILRAHEYGAEPDLVLRQIGLLRRTLTLLMAHGETLEGLHRQIESNTETQGLSRRYLGADAVARARHVTRFWFRSMKALDRIEESFRALALGKLGADVEVKAEFTASEGIVQLISLIESGNLRPKDSCPDWLLGEVLH